MISLSAAIAVLGAALLAYSIVRTLRVVRDSVLVRLPAVTEQDVDFAQAGPVVLCVERTRLSTALFGARYALCDAAGAHVPSTPILFRTSVSGISRVRLSLRSFDIPRAGRYRFVTTGIAAGRDTSNATLVFTRPHTAALILCILGMVLGGVCLIGGVVFTALGLVGK
jgi:hypothetical protein